jgi:hypothetical protein
MCQECVKDGRMTQAELDQRIAAGDRNVIPIDELTLQEFMVTLSELTTEAIGRGMPKDEAFKYAAAEMDKYLAARETVGRPVTDAERDALVNPWEAQEAARWN